MTIEPFGQRIVIRPIIDTRTASGLFISETAVKKAPCKGEVIHAGESKKLKKGDVILFKQYTPEEIEVDKELLLVLEESDVLCRLV